MGSSIELSEDLKLKLIDAYKSGKGYKKISKRFGFSISTIRNVIKKWKIRGTVEVKPRSGRPRKISDKTARLLCRKATQNPHMTAKDLQEGLADAGVMVHPSTVQRCLNKQGLHGRVRRKPEADTSTDKSTSEVKETSG
ncbi:histone H2A.Z-specific chaperone CHZ1-like, partial [Lates japonicus]